jgi:hypothetical protein
MEPVEDAAMASEDHTEPDVVRALRLTCAWVPSARLKSAVVMCLLCPGERRHGG